MFFTSLDGVRELSHKRIEAPDGSVYVNHIHPHCEMLFFVEGEADYNIDGQILRPRPGDILCIPAATYHYLMPKAAIPYENYVIGVEPERLPEEQYRLLFSAPYLMRMRDDEVVRRRFADLDAYRRQYSDADFARCAEAAMTELFTYLYYRKREHGRTDEDAALTYPERIVRYIADHLREPMDAERISRHFLLSPSYVQNLFSSHMHIGLRTYILQKKIFSAHGDLLRGDRPKDVCERYAFGDYSSFYRLYKKTFGHSPKGT